ncbi:MAG: hypothetical protein WED81_02950 [Rhodothermales bacterium]
MSQYRRSASFLIVVFILGGLAAPLMHRFEHVHREQHRHGGASTDFRGDHPGRPQADFLVEEQTPPDDLRCNLCARLAHEADAYAQSFEPFFVESGAHLTEAWAHTHQSRTLLPIRAPPVAV